jgi:photosystem II stability/assembly factor-like uncharacterized protein
VYVTKLLFEGPQFRLTSQYADIDDDIQWIDQGSLQEIIDEAADPYKLDDGSYPGYLMIQNHIATENGMALIFKLLDYTDKPIENGVLVCVYSNETDSWTLADPQNDPRTIIAKMVQCSDDRNHLLLLLESKHVEIYGQIEVKELIRESYDGGESWSRFTEISDISSDRIRDIQLVNDTYYVSHVQDWILKIKEDDRNNWEGIDLATTQNQNTRLAVGELHFDKTNPGVVYGVLDGGSGFGGLIKSTDMLQTWSFAEKGLQNSQPSNVAVHPENSDIIVTSGNTGHFPHITRDGGLTWHKLNNTDRMGDELVFDPHDPDHMILVTEMGQIIESINGGADWNPVAERFSSARVFDIVATNYGEGVLYTSIFGLGISQFTSLNQYDQFSEVGMQIEFWKHLYGSSDYAYDLELDPIEKDVVYATYSPKLFENHSSLWKYDADQPENRGWTEILKVNNSKGMTSVTVDPKNNNNLFVGITGEYGMILKTEDGGSSWSKMNEFFIFSNIHTLAIDPNNEARLFAAPWGAGLYGTNDGGLSWEKIDAPTISVSSILIDPENSNHVVIGDRLYPNIYESFDSGESWIPLVELPPEDYYRISAMTFAYGTLFFSTFDRIHGITAVFEEPMSGTSFVFTDEGPVPLSGDMQRAVLNFHSTGEELFAVSHIKGVYRFDGDWIESTLGLPDMGFNDLTIDHFGRMYLSGGCDIDPTGERRIGDDFLVNNVFVSDNHGEEWYPILDGDPFKSGIKAVEVHPLNSDIIIAATGTGGYVSKNAGATWAEQNDGLGFRNIGCLAVSEHRVYVGTLGGGVYSGNLSPEGDIEWMEASGPNPEIFNLQIKIHPQDSQIIFVTSYPGGVFKSTDFGSTWIESNFAIPSFQVEDPMIEGYYSLEIDRDDPDVLYLGLFNGGIYKSTDGGGTWLPLYGEAYENFEVMRSGIRRVKANPADEMVYAVSDNGVFRSADAGASWISINEGLDTLDILSIDIDENGTVYIGTNGYGVYIWKESLNQWEFMGRCIGVGEWAPWERRLYQYSAVLFDAENPGLVYYGNFPGGFFFSEDNGKSWRCSSLGLGNDGMFSLTQHPIDPNIIYAGTYNGIWKSTDRGYTWTDSSNGLSSEQWPFTVAIDDHNPDIMYVTTKNGQNKGFMDRNSFGGVVAKSIDGGKTWKKIMNGLQEMSEYYSLIIHPDNHELLFISSSYGVYASMDSGESWYPMNDGIPIRIHELRDNVAENLKLTPDLDTLIFGVGQYGVWKADITPLFG